MITRLEQSDEAVSEVVAYLLILGIIIMSVGIITVLAVPLIQDSKEEA